MCSIYIFQNFSQGTKKKNDSPNVPTVFGDEVSLSAVSILPSPKDTAVRKVDQAIVVL